VAAAKTPDEQTLASERLINFQWEARVDWEQLRAKEARIALETKLADLVALNQDMLDAHVRLAGKALDEMQKRYGKLTARQELEWKREAAAEKKKAAKADDPLERYRARNQAELLELKAAVLKNENALATSPNPSLEEQSSLADHAERELASLKHLLDDGRVS